MSIVLCYISRESFYLCPTGNNTQLGKLKEQWRRQVRCPRRSPCSLPVPVPGPGGHFQSISPHIPTSISFFLSFFPSLRKRTNRRIYKVKARGWAMLLPPSPYLARTVAPYTTFIDQFLSQKENVQNMYINICALKSCSSSLLRSQDSGNDTVSPHRTFHNFVSSLLPWSSSCQVMLADGVLFGCSLNPLQCLNMMPTQSVIQQKFSLV
jgi:hypothetical protein